MGTTLVSGFGQIALCGVRLSNVRQQPLPRAIKRVPTTCNVQWRNGHQFATIEAHQRCIDQFFNVHHLGEGVEVDPGALPDFGAGSCRQDRLDVHALGCQFQVQALRQEQHISLGGTVNGHAELWRQAHHRPEVDD